MNIGRVSECEKKIRSGYDQLSPSERRVADSVLSNMQAVLDYSIADLASTSNVSEPTVVRFCRRIGFRGLKDMKLSIAKNLTVAQHRVQLPHSGDIMPGDSIGVVKHKVTYGMFQALQDTMDILDDADLQRAVDLLHQSHYIEIFGVGGSSMIARQAHHNFRKLGMRITLCTDLQTNYFMTEQYAPGDIVFAISNSGETESVVNAVSYAKSRGAVVISITGMDNSELKKLSDINMSAMSRSFIIPGDHAYVRAAQISIVNLLYAGLCAKRA